MNNTNDESSLVGTPKFTSSFVLPPPLPVLWVTTLSCLKMLTILSLFTHLLRNTNLYGTSQLAPLQLSGPTARTNHTYWSFMKAFSLSTACNTLCFALINCVPMRLWFMMFHTNLTPTAYTAST